MHRGSFVPTDLPPMHSTEEAASATVRQWVLSFRQHEGRSLREAEQDSGIPFTTIARIERGEGNVTLATLMQIVRWTGDAGDLFGSLADLAEASDA